MNILPKKRWHVRTKENIARVRKDEAEAAEKERQEKLRIEHADREARLCVLKQKSKQRLLESGFDDTIKKTESTDEHINLFENFDNAIETTNKEHDKEVKEKKEDYEKKIGYLTYLGQDTNEALGKKNWYEVAPGVSRFTRTNNIKDTYNKLVLKDDQGNTKDRNVDIKNGEICWKEKQRYDPVNTFKKYNNDVKKIKDTKSDSLKNELCVSKKKNKNDDKNNKLQKLRDARHKREQQEKYKTELFLKKLVDPGASVTKEPELNKIKPKYNSQFNPELARQNYR